jgi:hypothetical protein
MPANAGQANGNGSFRGATCLPSRRWKYRAFLSAQSRLPALTALFPVLCLDVPVQAFPCPAMNLLVSLTAFATALTYEVAG